MDNNHITVLERLHRLEIQSELHAAKRNAVNKEEEKLEVEIRLRRLEKQLGINKDSKGNT